MTPEERTRRWIEGMGRCAALLLAALFFICPARADSGIDTWSALQEAVDRAGDGEIIVLSRDLTALEADEQITVPEGKRLTLDLNGHVLDASMPPNQDGHLRCVLNISAGAILTLRDSGGSAPRGRSGELTGGFHDNGGGIRNRGTLIMEGGCVTGNTAQKSGGGIANLGTMVITGGSVTGNTALRDGCFSGDNEAITLIYPNMTFLSRLWTI